jgi:hypothetical protein
MRFDFCDTVTSDRVSAIVDLDAGTAVAQKSGSGANESASIVDVGTYYIVTLSGSINETTGCFQITNATYGAGAIDIVGAQLELSSKSTSYIPTTSGTETRAQDTLLITDINAFCQQSSGVPYNASEGTIVLEYEPLRLGVTQGVFTFGSTYNDRISLYISATNQAFFAVTTSGVAQTSLATGADAVGLSPQKTAIAYKANNCQLVHNGIASSVDTSCTIPSVVNGSIGSVVSGGFPANVLIKSIQYFPVRKTQAEMEALTS